MKRYAMEELLAWKNKQNRKPLILKGARQVGKTWLMKEFGNLYFENVAYINFDNNQRMKAVFDTDYDIERILMALSIETKQTIHPKETLIIFDEVQEAPRVIAALKYFQENAPEYAVIAAGSLLGVAIHKGVSFPVGKVDMLELHPLSFREFLEAVGENGLVELIGKQDYAMMSAFRDKYDDWLKKYYYIGGMPEVVANFVSARDFVRVREIQNNIVTLYENDFGKRTSDNELAKIRMVWNSIPMQLAKENKKFFFGQIKEGARAKDFELAIEWLLDCGLIKKVCRINKPAIPLKAYAELSAFKLFLLDIGLLGALSDLDVEVILNGNDLFVEFKGALTEQYVLQQLVSDTTYTPYYYASKTSTCEIDFMVQKNGVIVPVEVKAEDNLQSKSLRVFCEKHKPKYAVRTSMADYRQQEWMTNIPLYAIHNL